jgi:hypothetical protein
MTVTAAEGAANPQPRESAGGAQAAEIPDKKAALREQAMADAGVQDMLDVFAAEIRDVEEMKD